MRYNKITQGEDDIMGNIVNYAGNMDTRKPLSRYVFTVFRTTTCLKENLQQPKCHKFNINKSPRVPREDIRICYLPIRGRVTLISVFTSLEKWKYLKKFILRKLLWKIDKPKFGVIFTSYLLVK